MYHLRINNKSDISAESFPELVKKAITTGFYMSLTNDINRNGNGCYYLMLQYESSDDLPLMANARVGNLPEAERPRLTTDLPPDPVLLQLIEKMQRYHGLNLALNID